MQGPLLPGGGPFFVRDSILGLRCDLLCYNPKMQKVAEYLQRATECRDSARSASQSDRKELEHMAIWFEHLAQMRKHRLERSEKSDDRSGK